MSTRILEAKCLWAKCPWGKMYVGKNVLGAKCPLALTSTPRTLLDHFVTQLFWFLNRAKEGFCDFDLIQEQALTWYVLCVILRKVKMWKKEQPGGGVGVGVGVGVGFGVDAGVVIVGGSQMMCK